MTLASQGLCFVDFAASWGRNTGDPDVTVRRHYKQLTASSDWSASDQGYTQTASLWRAITRNRIIGPIFCYDTGNSDRYCELILCTFTGHFNEDKIARDYLQQDGATAHTTRFHDATARCVGRQKKKSKDFGHHVRPISHSLIIICGEQWRAQFYKDNPHTLLEVSVFVSPPNAW